MKNKQLAINFFANLVAFAIQTGLTFFLTPYMVSKVGSEAYGFVPLALNMISYVSIFTTAINMISCRYISIAINSNDDEQANVFFNSALRANTVLALALIVPFALIVLFIGKVINVPENMVFDVQLTFMFTSIAILALLMGNVFNVATFSKNRLEINSFKTAEASVLKLLLTVLLFTVFSPKIYYITLAMAVFYAYISVSHFFYTKKLLPQIKISSSKYSFDAVKTLLRSGVWNVLDQLSVVLMDNVDLLVANVFLGSVLAGQYSLAKTIHAFLVILLTSIVLIFAPQFTIFFAKKNKEELIYTIKLSMKSIGLIAMIPVTFFLFFGDVFYSLWLPGEDSQLLALLSGLITLPIALSASTATISSVYTVLNKLKVPAIVMLATGIANTLLSIILLNTTSIGVMVIPFVYIAISLLRNLVFTPLYAAKSLEIKLWSLYVPILQGMLCTAITSAICFTFKTFVAVDSWMSLILAAGCCVGSAIIISALVILSRDEKRSIFSLIKKKAPAASSEEKEA